MNKEIVKNVVITEVRLKELLIAELFQDYGLKHINSWYSLIQLDEKYIEEKQKIMNTNYSDKGVITKEADAF